ncbi:MAG: pitrilysin family protein [Rhodospirillaceae bacterium]|nr:pitrilysin family protein [Rhodospirillaceae bacterium]
MRLSFFARLMLPATLLVAGPAAAELYGAKGFTLANGMEVVVIPNHRAPVVSHMVWYRAGAAEEPPGKSGIAHFLEHLMFKGTPKYPGGIMDEVVARNGGDQNAFTSYDFTGYYQNIAVDRLPLVMEIEADRMRNLVLDVKDVDTEREVIIEERRMRVDNQPASILDERLDAALWLTNRYAIPIIGWEHEMRGLTREDAFAFYHRFYAPENAILVVSGDITTEQLKPLAEKYYGAIPRGGEAARPERLNVMPPPADVRVEYRDARVRQPRWWRRWVAPSFNVGDKADIFAIDVFAEIAGGGSTSKLYRTLVVDQKVVASVNASYDAGAISYGSFTISLSPSPGVTPDQAEAALEGALEKLLRDGISDDDVTRAKDRMLAKLVFAKDAPLSAGQAVGGMMVIGIPLAEIETMPERIKAVTPDQVRAAARKLISTSASGTAVLLPKAEG